MEKYFRNFLVVAFAAVLSMPGASAAPVYVASLKNARMDAITTAIGTTGKLVIGTSALSGATGVLCTFTLNSTAAAAASGGVWTLSGTPKTCTVSAPGTAAKAEYRTSADVTVLSLTVSTTGADLNFDNTSFASGQTVTLTSHALTHN